MKSIFKSIFVAAFTIVSASSFAQKTASIDFDSLINIMPEMIKAKDSSATYYKQLESRLISYEKELNEKLNDYQVNQSKYSPLVKEQMEKDLQALNQRMKDFQVLAQNDYQAFTERLTKPITEKAKKAIEKIAKSRGYKHVIDSSAGILLFTDPADNIFNLVKAELGIK